MVANGNAYTAHLKKSPTDTSVIMVMDPLPVAISPSFLRRIWRLLDRRSRLTPYLLTPDGLVLFKFPVAIATPLRVNAAEVSKTALPRMFTEVCA